MGLPSTPSTALSDCQAPGSPEHARQGAPEPPARAADLFAVAAAYELVQPGRNLSGQQYGPWGLVR
jgi:hypothetical protein